MWLEHLIQESNDFAYPDYFRMKKNIHEDLVLWIQQFCEAATVKVFECITILKHKSEIGNSTITDCQQDWEFNFHWAKGNLPPALETEKELRCTQGEFECTLDYSPLPSVHILRNV